MLLVVAAAATRAVGGMPTAVVLCAVLPQARAGAAACATVAALAITAGGCPSHVALGVARLQYSCHAAADHASHCAAAAGASSLLQAGLALGTEGDAVGKHRAGVLAMCRAAAARPAVHCMRVVSAGLLRCSSAHRLNVQHWAAEPAKGCGLDGGAAAAGEAAAAAGCPTAGTPLPAVVVDVAVAGAGAAVGAGRGVAAWLASCQQGPLLCVCIHCAALAANAVATALSGAAVPTAVPAALPNALLLLCVPAAAAAVLVPMPVLVRGRAAHSAATAVLVLAAAAAA